MRRQTPVYLAGTARSLSLAVFRPGDEASSMTSPARPSDLSTAKARPCHALLWGC